MAVETLPFGELFAEPTRNGLTRPKATRGEGVKMVNMGELFAHPRLCDARMDRVPLTRSEANRFLLNAGDLLFARQSLVLEGAGKCSIFLKDHEPVTFESHVTRVRLDPRKANPCFYFYYFQSHHGRAAIRSIVEQGAGASRIRGSDLESLEVLWRPLPEQRAIAHILGALDDKIELSWRMNETLEAIARALFKSWFVDFDPVRAKAEDCDPGLPKPLADLFPERFLDSELGDIPEEWEVGRLENVLAELVSGGRPKGGAVEEGVPSVGAENINGLGRYDFSKEKYVPRGFFDELRRKSSAVRPGDVLLYKDGAHIGRKTYFDCGFPHPECAINEHVFILRSKHPRTQRYLFFWLDQEWMTKKIISLNSNSAQPGINQGGVRSLPVLVSPSPIMDAFDRLTAPLTDRIFKSCIENQTLAAVRDALLPKLVSGDLRVRDAEKFVGGAT